MQKQFNLFQNDNWEEAPGYQKGTMRKVLRDENGGKTILLKLPAGFYMAPHSHITTEQHFVLEGEYESNSLIYSSGSYQIFAPGDEHGPFSSEKGAIILVVWDPLSAKK
jgi:anti-sigma factor ChrR (cupin superfamily)